MRRSEINSIIRDVDAFLKRQQFYLPPYAYWSPQEWRTKGPEAREIVERNMGWDITDFGSGDYRNVGLFLFTVRNGSLDDLRKGTGKTYCEKVLVCDPKQLTPLHYHWNKVEDIINRGGGDLAIQLFNGNADGSRQEDTDVTVSLDGVTGTVKAATTLILKPGESITLTPYLYHAFWAEGTRTLVGEVSLVNDDNSDNCFYQKVGRFPVIEEDEAPVHLLVNDYKRYYRA